MLHAPLRVCSTRNFPEWEWECEREWAFEFPAFAIRRRQFEASGSRIDLLLTIWVIIFPDYYFLVILN